MAKVTQAAQIGLSVHLTINEQEARALEALAGYGIKEFINTFYKEMGHHYLEPHEKGLVSFLEMVKDQIPTMLSRADRAREAFKPK